MTIDYASFLRSDLGPAAQAFGGFPEYNFVGGHNDADSVPVAQLNAAASAVIAREGRNLATYGMNSGPQGYLPLRNFIAQKLKSRAAMECRANEILVTSGSLQALDLVNAALLESGDTVLVEEASYGGAYARLRKLGVNFIGIRIDDDGIDTEHLAAVLADLKNRNIRAKYIYTIPTVQNPTGTVMSRALRLELLRLASEYNVMVFEDDCYADLLWEGERPPTIHALDNSGRVIYCGSFSKSIAPALRVGYIVAPWALLSRLLPLKTDGGTGALEQMVLAEYSSAHFDDHVRALSEILREKSKVMIGALDEQFGSSVELSSPKGGIFIWVTLPRQVDTTALAAAALAQGVAINPGADWAADPDGNRHRMRLCFGHASKEQIRAGIALLADICHRETGIPVRSGNVSRA